MRICCACLLMLYAMGCNDHASNVATVPVADTFQLPGIPSDKTLHFKGDTLYYESMDEPGNEAIKCYGLGEKKLLWSFPIGNMSINQGAVTTENEYVVPTLSDTVYLINEQGKARILKLEYRCKINPLVYKGTFILQDRGVGLKCFDAKTLQQLWLIKQESSNTMSQPLLVNGNIIYVLDDKRIRSSNASTGALNWEVPVDDTLSLHDIYGQSGEYVFILSTSLQKEKYVYAIGLRDGVHIWRSKQHNAISEWERDMYVRADTIFCRGDTSVVLIKRTDGTSAGEYTYPSVITTNIVADKNDNILFALENNKLVQVSRDGKDMLSAPFPKPINRLYRYGEQVYIYSYPYLYLLDQKETN